LDLRRNQIRLLQIYPDAWNEPIRCGFQVVSLDESPSYVALSYVWGRGEENCVVTVDGKVVHVKPNLYAALRRLRAHSREDNIWVDALCIDQACTRERNHQVRIMGQIYSKCREVLVWMG
ncbi:HET-domain-containing protein, partial [Trematosphaeria pertusa]